MGTRLGLSAGLMAAAAYFFALFGGWTPVPLLVLVGYVLLFETNEWLKISAVKAIGVLFCFTLLRTLIGFIPSFNDFILDMLRIFSTERSNIADDFFFSGYYLRVGYVVDFIRSGLFITQNVLLIILALKAFKHQTIWFGPVDNIIARHVQRTAPPPQQQQPMQQQPVQPQQPVQQQQQPVQQQQQPPQQF